jgi:RHS repeat-associated protein
VRDILPLPWWYKIRPHSILTRFPNVNSYFSALYSANALTQACPEPPAAPSNLTALVLYSSIVRLNWTDNSDNEDGFEISRCLGLICYEILVGANVTTYDDSPCGGGSLASEAVGGREVTSPGGTTYSYFVKAYNQVGESAGSNTVFATVDCSLGLDNSAAVLTESPPRPRRIPTGQESNPQCLVSDGKDDTAATSLASPEAGTQAATMSMPPPGQTWRSYYFFGSQRIAMRTNGVVQYLLGDHLGSTSLVIDASGTKVAESRYYPYGEERWHWPEEGTLPTDYRFTGQQQDSASGIYHMGARFYDPSLARWLSADTLVPESEKPQHFNRYSYVSGNPLAFIDPTGHEEEGACTPGYENETCEGQEAVYEAYWQYCTETGWAGSECQGMPVEEAVFWFVVTVSGAELAVGAIEGAGIFLVESGADWIAYRVGKSTVEEFLESQMTGRPFDLTNVLLDAGTEVLDEAYTAARYGGGICFEAGTLVSTEQGQVPIETVRIGDLAFALDAKMGVADYFTVTGVFSHHVNSLVEVAIADDVIRATEEHPFWVVDEGWIGAAALTPGDCVQTREGGCRPVVSVRKVPADTWVYNLTVIDAHTYFVTDSEYLVHNQCSPQVIYRSGDPNPGNLTPRPQDDGKLSFRDSLSNPWPLSPGQRPVFRPGDRYLAVDATQLPAGSVIYDNVPPGHVSVVNTPHEVIRGAVIGRGKLPR